MAPKNPRKKTRSTHSERPSDTAKTYARDVVGGKIPAGKYVRLACQRFLDDLNRTDWPYEFDADRADHAVRFMELMPHTKGKWASKKERLALQPWQRFIECNLFGWIHKDTKLRRFREAYEEEPRKNGKALAVDTPIPTPNGWVRHGDLREGDFVFAPDGRQIRVLWNSGSYMGPCRSVEFKDCDPIIAHDAHEWITERTWYTKRHRGPNGKAPLPPVETAEIAQTLRGGSRGDFVHRVKVCAPVHTEDADLPIPPYTMGAWLGDGTSAKQHITTADKEVVDAIALDGFPVKALCQKGAAKTYSMWNGDIGGSTSLKSKLQAIGALGNKHIPAQYLRASVAQRLELLRGLLDTDGHATPRGQIQFCSTSKRLAAGVVELVRSLGMKPTCREGRATISGRDCGPKWNVEFFPADETPLFKITRKLARQTILGHGKRRCRARTIIAADPAGDFDVNCIEVEGGMYLAGSGFVPTHNSARVAARGIYMFCADGEAGAEVYAGATTEKQAYEVFRPAWQMVQKLKALRDRYGVEQAGNPKNPGPMYVTEDMSKFETMIGKPGDGSSPHAAIIDEYHEHDTDHMVDAMQTGMGAREQPLLSIITTAGSNLGGPCFEKRRDIIRILEGQVQDETVFGIIYGIDEGDRWDDPASLIKANPNYGVSVFPEFLLAQLEQAKRSASKQNSFRTKHLNEWVGARTAWMNMLAWQRQKREYTLDDMHGRPCWIGVDLASKKDVAALVMLFEKDSQLWCAPKFYVPESALEENEKYRQFATAGDLIVTPGAQTHTEFIERDLLDIAKRVSIESVAFDDWQANDILSRLQKTSLKDRLVIFNQTVRNMSEPMKEVEARVLSRSLWHDGNPMMTWMMGNVSAKIDAKENIYPRKDNDNDPFCKIDGVVALIMAMGRAMLGAEEKKPLVMRMLG